MPGLRRTGIRTHEVGRRGLRAIHCAGRLWDAAQVAIDAGVCCVASLMSCDERMDGKVVRERVGAEADLVNLAHLRGTHELFDITQTGPWLHI